MGESPFGDHLPWRRDAKLIPGKTRTSAVPQVLFLAADLTYFG